MNLNPEITVTGIDAYGFATDRVEVTKAGYTMIHPDRENLDDVVTVRTEPRPEGLEIIVRGAHGRAVQIKVIPWEELTTN